MRILFLSRWFPYPADNGSKIRISNLMRQLAVEHEVTLVSFTAAARPVDLSTGGPATPDCQAVFTAPYPGYRPSSLGALAGLFVSKPRSLVASHSPQLADTVTRALRQQPYDLIVASELDMLPYALINSGVPILFDDLELAVYRDGFGRHRRLGSRVRASLTWYKLGAYLRRALPQVAHCTVVSDQEREHVRSVAPEYERVSLVPNAVDLGHYAGSYGAPALNTLVFSGSLSYSVNLDALRWFLADIFPRIRRDIPDVRLRVTGSTDGIDLSAFQTGSDVEFTGYVDDVRPLVATSWVSVVPLRHGGGTRLKILEAMALGTPVVSTTKGAEGLSVSPGADIIVQDDPDGFARGVVNILRSSDLRCDLAGGGRRLVSARYDWRVLGADVRALVHAVVGGSGSESGVGSSLRGRVGYRG